MKILALEFSSSVRSAAVIGAPRIGCVEERGDRQMKPFALIDAALAKAGMARDDIECLAVGLGPGSHAGIRTAIAIAQGWQLARGVRLLGISSADAVAAQAGRTGDIAVRIGLDGQRGELFVARYDTAVWTQPRLIEPFNSLNESERDEQRHEGLLYRMDLPAGVATANGVGTPPSAEAIAILAAERSDFVSGNALEPIYLRQVEFIKASKPRFGQC